MRQYLERQASSNLTCKHFKGPYTVYFWLRRSSHHFRRAVFRFPHLLPVPVGCNGTRVHLLFPVSGKFLAIDCSLHSRWHWGPGVGDGEKEKELLLDTDVPVIFMVADFQISLMFQKLALHILSVPRELAISYFEIILCSKTFLIWGLSPIEHFSSFDSFHSFHNFHDVLPAHVPLVFTWYFSLNWLLFNLHEYILKEKLILVNVISTSLP